MLTHSTKHLFETASHLCNIWLNCGMQGRGIESPFLFMLSQVGATPGREMIFLTAFLYEQEIFVNVAYFIQRPYINDDDAGTSHSYKEARQLSLLNPAATLQTKQNPT